MGHVPSQLALVEARRDKQKDQSSKHDSWSVKPPFYKMLSGKWYGVGGTGKFGASCDSTLWSFVKAMRSLSRKERYLLFIFINLLLYWDLNLELGKHYHLCHASSPSCLVLLVSKFPKGFSQSALITTQAV